MQPDLERFTTKSFCNPLVPRPQRLSMSPQIPGSAPSPRKPTGTVWALYVVTTRRLRVCQHLATLFLGTRFHEPS